MRDGSLSVTSDGTRVLVGRDERYLDPDEQPAAAPDGAPTPASVNNRLRNAISTGLASLGLTATDPAQRRAAARACRSDPIRRSATA